MKIINTYIIMRFDGIKFNPLKMYVTSNGKYFLDFFNELREISHEEGEEYLFKN